MAYDRYAVELTDKDGQIYGVMDAEAREEVSELNSAIVNVGDFVNYNILENDWDGNYVVNTAGGISQSDSYRTSKPIFLKLGETIKVSSALYSSSQCQIFRVTSDGTFIDASVVTAGGNVVETNTYTCRIDGGAYYAYSGRIETAPITAEKYLRKIDVAYIAPDGSNNNAGTYESPFATVNFALSLGAKKIIAKPGKYFQTIDLNNAVEKNIEICALTKSLFSEFYNPNSLIGSSETKVSGYTKVYSMTCNKTISSGNIWLFQDGATTPETLISADERLPIQRGQRNRVDSAGRIIKCSASNLSDALTEIDTSENDVYKWYLDGTTLYFSRRETVSASLPIRYSDGTNFIANGTRDISLSLTGLSIKYMALNIDETTDTKVSDCRVGYVYGDGAVTYDGAINALFTRVEAFMCFNGVNGDGFNAHGVNSGNSFAKQTTATLIDCWAHDNNDDGFSDHERCESTIIGGLFEYNGKAGVTPSYGSHCNCYNVFSRRNWSGFFCTGAPESAEGGIGTQLYCIGCIAENNGVAGNQKSGFVVNGTGNILIAENCKSIGQFVGYNALPNAFIRLRDCTAKDNDYNLNREGTIVVDNTTLVT